VALILLTWAASFVIGFEVALTLLSLVGFGAAIVGLRWPAIGLLGMSMLFTLDTITSSFLLTRGFFRWNTFNYLLLVVMLVHMPFLLRLSDLQSRLLQLLVLLLGLELLISPNRVQGAQVVLSVVTLFGLLVYFVRASHDEQNWYWMGLVCGFLAAIGGLVFYLQKNQLPYVNPNNWSFFPLTALFAICMCFHLARKHGRGYITLILLAVVNFIWIFLSGSRGDLLIAICCLVFLTVRLQGVWQRSLVFVAAALLGLVISIQFAELRTSSLNRLDLLIDPARGSLRQRTSGRSDLVLGGWYIFLDHPFGVGTGGFQNTWAGIGFVEGLSGYGQGVEKPAHSGWIKVLAENGIPGGLLLASYVLSFAVAGWRSHDRDRLALGLLTAAALSIAFISLEFTWGKGLWFLAAGATTLLHREQIAAHLRGASRREPILNIVRPGNIRHG